MSSGGGSRGAVVLAEAENEEMDLCSSSDSMPPTKLWILERVVELLSRGIMHCRCCNTACEVLKKVGLRSDCRDG